MPTQQQHRYKKNKLTLLVERDESLGDRLPDGVDLRSVSTTLDLDANIHILEPGLAEEKHGLVRLYAKNFGLKALEGLAVDLDETAAALAVSDSDGRLLLSERLHGIFAVVNHLEIIYCLLLIKGGARINSIFFYYIYDTRDRERKSKRAKGKSR